MTTDSLTLENFVAIDQLLHREQFRNKTLLDLLGKNLEGFIKTILADHGVTNNPIIKGKVSPHAIIKGPVYVAEGAEVGPGAYIEGPAYIGPGAEVRHAAFIRGNVYVGPEAVVGHTTEAKGSVFLDGAKAGHFAYVGDSILGRLVNLGAGTKLANLKLKGNEVKLKCPRTGELRGTGLRKLGAILGDEAQTGCNAVLSPGTILMPKTLVMPCTHFQGTLLKGIAE